MQGRGYIPEQLTTGWALLPLGMSALVVTLSTAAAGGLTWLDEPFPDWQRYAERTGEAWLFFAQYLTGLTLLVGFIAAAASPLHTLILLRALAWLWLLFPLTLAWSLCAWLAGTHHWTFTFTGGFDGNAQYLPAWTEAPLELLGSGWTFLGLLSAWIYIVTRRCRTWLAYVRCLRSDCCTQCGYPLAGLKSGVCPECGRAEAIR